MPRFPVIAHTLLPAGVLALGLIAAPCAAPAQEKGAASAHLPAAGDFNQILPLTARGNEPGWVLQLTTDGAALSTQEGATGDFPLPQARGEGADLILALAADTQLRLSPVICRDSMTGMPYPLAATLERAGQSLSGCAGDPARLLAGDWRLTEMAGQALPDGAEITLSVMDGQVGGKSACNRYIGAITIGGEGIGIGPLAGTRMACAQPVMAVETAYLQGLGRVSGFDIADDGGLILTADGDALLTFGR